MKDIEKEHDGQSEIKSIIIRIAVSTALLAAAVIVDKLIAPPILVLLAVYLVPYLVIGLDVLFEAFVNIIHGKLFDEAFLMSTATVGAFCIAFIPGGKPEFIEGVLVMLLFKIGELFEELAEDKSRRSIASLMNIRPDTARIMQNGEVITVSPDAVKVGDILIVRPGERIALDGTVLEGASSIDTVALTGESVPRSAEVGDTVISGCVNLSGVLYISVAKEYGDSTVARILELVENSAEVKSKSESFITKFAKYYTPAVVISAVVLALLPPLISGNFTADFVVWLRRALTFLIVSCPCALVISVPLAFFMGIGGASGHGVLIKGSSYVEALAKTELVAFDKTGTLTCGSFEVTAIHPYECTAEALLQMAAHAEKHSTHPIALSLRRAYGKECDKCEMSDIKEFAGEGVSAKISGDAVLVGNERLMARFGVGYTKTPDIVGTTVHVAVNEEYKGCIEISDRIKPDSSEAVKKLHAIGVQRVIMLTGDHAEAAEKVAIRLGIAEYRSELMPEDKVNVIKGFIEERKASRKKRGTLVFVGDGINDAPVLSCADVGIAMGAFGSDAAMEAADVVLMDDKPSKLVKAIRICKKTVKIAKENIILALIIKATVLGLAVFGIAPMWLAVFADVGVTLLAVMNSFRAMR